MFSRTFREGVEFALRGEIKSLDAEGFMLRDISQNKLFVSLRQEHQYSSAGGTSLSIRLEDGTQVILQKE